MGRVSKQVSFQNPSNRKIETERILDNEDHDSEQPCSKTIPQPILHTIWLENHRILQPLTQFWRHWLRFFHLQLSSLPSFLSHLCIKFLSIKSSQKFFIFTSLASLNRRNRRTAKACFYLYFFSKGNASLKWQIKLTPKNNMRSSMPDSAPNHTAQNQKEEDE